MKRVLTAIVAIPIVLLITLLSPDWLFALSVALVSAVAVEEFLSLAAKKGIGRPGRWFLALAAFVAFSFIHGPWWVLMALVLTILILMTVAVFGDAIDKALGGSRHGIGRRRILFTDARVPQHDSASADRRTICHHLGWR
jgi:CDP-diglyceride synthetase